MVHAFVPHARQREDKTEALLDAAMGLLDREGERDGLDALTLQRVARELGLVTTAIYRYFPSKDALLAALQRRAIEAIHRHFTATLAEQRARLAARRLAPEVAALVPILLAARTYVELPATHPEMFRLLSLMLGDTRALIADEEARAAVPLVAGFLGEIRALFAHAADVKATAHCLPPDQCTLVFWSALHGLAQLEKLRRLAPEAPDARSLADAAAAALLRGFGAAPTHVTRALRALSPILRS